MGIFDDLKNAGKAVTNIAMLPVDATLDVLCINPALKEKLMTGERLERIADAVEDIGKDDAPQQKQEG